MQLFYCKDITPNAFCTLDAEESRHAVRVLRLREGDELNVTDGKGNLYTCQIVEASDKACSIQSISPLTFHLSPRSGAHQESFAHGVARGEGCGDRRGGDYPPRL